MTHSYLPRLVDTMLERRLAHHPAIMLVGPRATGKTTTAARWARSELRLDDPARAVVVEADPDAALRDLAEPVLIDEWQVVPSILHSVKRTVDSDPRPGRFLITGSVRGDMDSPTWPGTGRIVRIAMSGLTVSETRETTTSSPLLDLISRHGVEPLLAPIPESPDLKDYLELASMSGFPYPALTLPPSERSVWLESYIEHMLTRDVSLIAGNRDPERIRRYLTAYAVNTAGVVDHNTLYTAAGLAKATGEEYDRLLRNLLVTETLPAWWSNRLKRLTKSPKRYLADPALALAVLRIDVNGLMRDGQLLGRIIDTFVVAQLRAHLVCSETSPRLYHLRQENGLREIDLIVEYGGGRVFAIEIKAGNAPTTNDARHLEWLSTELGDRFIGGAVLHTGPRAFRLGPDIVAAPIATLWSPHQGT